MHEAGHVIMLRIMHRRVRAVRLTAFGICLDIGTEQTLSYREEIQAALCGPLVNLLLCVIFALRRDVSAAGINAALFLINMLPVNTLDGGRILCDRTENRQSSLLQIPARRFRKKSKSIYLRGFSVRMIHAQETEADTAWVSLLPETSYPPTRVSSHLSTQTKKAHAFQLFFPVREAALRGKVSRYR